MAVRVPKITSVETAVFVYYENVFLGNAEIKKLFGKIATERVVRLKRMAEELMKEKGQMKYSAITVKTSTAYEAWGLDIKDLEARYEKLLKYQKRKEMIGKTEKGG